MRKLVLVSVVLGSLFAAANAQAAIPSVFGGALTCTDAGTQRQCGTDTSSDSGSGTRSTAPSWDGTPIDVKVAFPADPSPSPDGNYPLIIEGHGYGGSKNDFSFNSMKRFTDRGYAVFAMTARGFHQSCGKANAVSAAAGACDAAGWIHLMDERYEVRDAQFFAGELADAGLIDGQKIGATGASYGGGLSMELAALKDRTMLPDGSLVPWTSPVNHDPMRIAGAVPIVPWSDLAYSLTPNGGTLDYVADSAYSGRTGVEKLSFQNGLYLSGQLSGLYCGQTPYSACNDFGSDVTAWKARLDAGEPYDGDSSVAAILNEIKAHHSAYYVDHSESPAPMLIANGFSDDLFPADEAIREDNLIRSLYPNAPISLFFGDFGHMRAIGKADVSGALSAATDAWLDFYVKGTGSQPSQGATAYTLTCPASAPSGGPYQAGSWAGLSSGVVRFQAKASKTIAPGGGSASVDTTFDPVSGGGACATVPGTDLPGVATYRLPAAAGSGYTLLGSPTVIAKISSPIPNSELAARLLDVDPSGTETLVARQLFRPRVGTARQVFQLHPSGHLFAPGHVAKLELLPKDAGGTTLNSYGRAANGQGNITVSNLDLRLPVVDGPGDAGGQVKAAPPLPLPCGMAIAQQFSSSFYLRASVGDGKVRVNGRKTKVPVDSAPGTTPCRIQVQLLGPGKGSKASSAKKRKKANVLGRRTATVAGGQSKTFKFKLSKHGAAAIGRGKGIRLKVTTIDSAGNTVQVSKVIFRQKHHKKHR